jgi:hypothetical protein
MQFHAGQNRGHYNAFWTGGVIPVVRAGAPTLIMGLQEMRAKQPGVFIISGGFPYR